MRHVLGVLVAGLAVGSMACSGPTPSRAELVDALRDSGVPTPVARCTADAITDKLSKDQVAQIVERGPGGAPADDPDRTDDPIDKVRAALAVCRADLPTSTTTPAAPADSTVPGSTSAPLGAPGGGTRDETSSQPDGSGPAVTGPVFDTVPPTTTP